MPSLKSLGHLISRFQVTIFIVLVVAGLGAAVLVLNDILTDTSLKDGYVSPIDPGTIDKATLDRLEQLHTSDDTVPPIDLPQGRINPFSE